MAWSNSKLFASYVTDSFNRTAAFKLNGDTFKISLFDNSITPDQTVASANAAYGAGVWASGGVFDASGWPAAGRSLASITSTFAGNVFTFDAADTVSANGNTTLGACYGCLNYDSTLASPVANQACSYHYFGGAASVTNGTFTIVWNPSGIFGGTL